MTHTGGRSKAKAPPAIESLPGAVAPLSRGSGHQSGRCQSLRLLGSRRIWKFARGPEPLTQRKTFRIILVKQASDSSPENAEIDLPQLRSTCSFTYLYSCLMMFPMLATFGQGTSGAQPSRRA